MKRMMTNLPIAVRSRAQRKMPGSITSLIGAILVCGSFMPSGADATTGSGVSAEPITLGSLPEPIRVKFKDDTVGFGAGATVAQVTMVKFTVAPGGYFGWHRHGGPAWVVVAAGELTLYDSDDTTCTGHVYRPGSAFLDAGNHTHNARNEGASPVVVYGTFMLPAGGAVRIDADDPKVCAF
jgi:quercetin dioxygenase-like cupin family protein